jgi:hypothetical protein
MGLTARERKDQDGWGLRKCGNALISPANLSMPGEPEYEECA